MSSDDKAPLGSGAQHDVDWAMGQDGQGADFVSQTPPAVSYQSPSVRALTGRVRAAATVALGVVAMWAGYQIMAGSHTRGPASVQATLEVLPRLVLGVLLANTSLWWGALAIDGANALGSLAGPVVLPGRDVASDLPLVLELVASGLVYWLVALVLVLQFARDVFQGLFEVLILMTSRGRLKQHGLAGQI